MKLTQKVYTTPKKIKHKRVKVKLATLKFYKVDDGKVTRLRRECNSEGCGAGVFMASMYDRQYCGKCHKTFILDVKDRKQAPVAGAKKAEAAAAPAADAKKGKKGKK
jgi:ribosomal protein S27AE